MPDGRNVKGFLRCLEGQVQRCASERVQSSKLRRLGLRPRARWLHGFRGLVLQPQRDHGAVNAMLGLSFDHQIISVAGETIDDALHPDRIGKCGPAIEVTIIEHSAGRKGFEKVLRKGSLGSEKRQCAGLRDLRFCCCKVRGSPKNHSMWFSPCLCFSQWENQDYVERTIIEGLRAPNWPDAQHSPEGHTWVGLDAQIGTDFRIKLRDSGRRAVYLLEVL